MVYIWGDGDFPGVKYLVLYAAIWAQPGEDPPQNPNKIKVNVMSDIQFSYTMTSIIWGIV